jgi:glycosyltransferase involved in cell wall biosynthesis
MSKINNIIVNAVSTHSGGGLVLLRALVSTLQESGLEYIVIVDSRARKYFDSKENLIILFVKPSLVERFKSELNLRKLSKVSDKILSFGNLPPLFKLSSESILFVQSAYIIKPQVLSGFSLKQKLRMSIERLWFIIFNTNVDSFIVQTKSMQKLMLNVTDKKVEVFPFALFQNNQCHNINNIDFIYPSSGEPHKNHKNLIRAWILLSAKGINLSLYLTLDNNVFLNLVSWIESKVEKHSLNIINLGYVTQHNEMLNYVRSSKALIFPSKLESFGMPLIEAKYLKVPILASELDYVRDVAEPVQTFDPSSPESICNAVERYLGVVELNPILTPKQFLNNIISRD